MMDTYESPEYGGEPGYESEDQLWEDEIYETPEGDSFSYPVWELEPNSNFPDEDPFLAPWPKFLLIITFIACLILGMLLFFFPLHSPQSASNRTGENSSPVSEAELIAASEANEPPGSEGQAVISGDCSVSEQFPHSVRQWCDLITEHATKRGVPPDLVAALILQESGGNPQAYSRSGAVGLMQVMPRDGLSASFMCVNGPCFADRPSSAELKDPEFNVAYGTKMLAGLIGKNGNFRDALKSYGPANVGYYYADIVLGLFNRYGIN